MKKPISMSFAGDAREVFCGGDSSAGRVKRSSVFNLFRTFIIFGVITMQNAQAAENSLLENESLNRSFSGARTITALAWSPDQTKIAVRGRGMVYLWDISADEELWSAKGSKTVLLGIGISPDNKYLIFPSVDDAIEGHPETYSKQTALTLLPVNDPSSPVYMRDNDFWSGNTDAPDFAVAIDGSVIAAVLGSRSGWVTIYDPRTGSAIKHVGQFSSVGGIVSPNMIAIDSKRKLLAGAYANGEVHVWDYNTNKQISNFRVSTSGLNSLAINPANGEIITGGDGVIFNPVFDNGKVVSGIQDNPSELLKAWDSHTGKIVRAYPGNKYGVASISVSPNGQYIAATEGGSRVGMSLHLWNAETGALLKTISFSTSNGLCPVKFSPDSHKLAFGNDDEVHIYDLE